MHSGSEKSEPRGRSRKEYRALGYKETLSEKRVKVLSETVSVATRCTIYTQPVRVVSGLCSKYLRG